MAVQVGSLFASLTLESAGFTRGLSQAERATTATLGKIQRQAGLTGRSVDTVQRSVSQQIRPYSLIAVSRAFDNTADRANLLRGALIATTGVFGGFAAALTSNVILRYADTYTNLNNQLRVVSDSSSDLRAQFEALDQVATRSRSGLKETGILYARLSKAAPDLDPQQVLRYTETIQKSLQLGGATAQEAASAAVQFSQAISSNRLGGEELRAILETPLGPALAKGLGVGIGKLRELGTAGKLTADVVLGALEKIGPTIDKQFEGSVRTLDQAITLADNRFIAYIGSVDQAYGVTKILGNAVVGLADNLEGIGNILQVVIPAISGLFAAKLLGGVSGRLTAGIGNAIKDFQRVERIAEQSARGITGSWRELKSRTGAAFDQAGERVKGFSAQLAAAKAEQDKFANTVATAGRGAFADPNVINTLRRDVRSLEGLDDKRLQTSEKLRDAYKTLGTTNAQVTPRILAATKQVSDAETRLNALLAEQKNLRKAQVANLSRQANAGAGALRRPGPTKDALAEVRASAREQIRITKEIEKAQLDVARTRESLSQRLVGLSAAEAASQQAAANQRISALNTINSLTARSVEIDKERAAIQAKVSAGVSERDRQSASNLAQRSRETSDQIYKYQSQLGLAKIQQDRLAQSASLLGRTMTFTGAAFGSLFNFLGGPWGVALTVATIGLTVFAAKSAAAAQAAANAQEIISRRLGRISGDSQEAAEAFERIEQKAKLDELKKEAESLEAAFLPTFEKIEAAGRRLDFGLDNVTSPFETILTEGIDKLRNGLIDVDTLIAQVRNKGQIEAVNPTQVALVVSFLESLRDYAAVQLQIRTETDRAAASIGEFQSTFVMSARAMERAASVRRAVDTETVKSIFSEYGENEKKIATDIAAVLKSSGEKITPEIEKYIAQQARLIDNLDKVRTAANATLAQKPVQERGVIRRVGDADPNLRSVTDIYSAAKQADTLAKLQETRKAIVDIQNQMATARAVISGDLPLLEQAFGTKASTDRIKQAIAEARAEIKSLAAQVEAEKIDPVAAFNQLSVLRDKLVALGGDADVINPLVDDLTAAISANPKLRAELDATIAKFKALGKESNTTIFSGGSKSIKVGGTPQTPIVPGAPTAPVAPPPDEAKRFEDARAKAQADLATISQQIQNLPEQVLNKSMFGNDPAVFNSAMETAKGRLGEVTQKIIDGKIPADDFGVAINYVKQGLIDAGASSDALDPFVAALSASLSRMDPVISKLDRMASAMERLARASKQVDMPTGSPSGGSTSSPNNPKPAFAKGGVFKVGGAGGTDSQLVEFMASPTETVAVFTPKQVSALNERLGAGGGSGGTVVQAPITIMATDAASFRSARRQTQMDIADAVQSAVNRTR